MRIDWTVVLFQVLNFCIVVLILRRYLFRPVLGAMERRNKAIRDKLSGAEKLNKEAEAEKVALETARVVLEDSVGRVVEDAKRDAARKKDEMLDAFRADMLLRREAFEKQAAGERDALRKSMAAVAGKAIVRTVAGALSDLANAKVEDALLENFVARLENGKVEKLRELRELYAENRKVSVFSSFRIGDAMRKKIGRCLAALLGARKVEKLAFKVDSRILCGIEVICGSLSVSFGMDAYIESLSRNLDAALAADADAPPPAKHRKGGV
jgi:F-type H+-transporting ATPase subunit b